MNPSSGGANGMYYGGNGGAQRPSPDRQSRPTDPQRPKNPKKKKKKAKRHTFLSVVLSLLLIFFLTFCVVSGYVFINALMVIKGNKVIDLNKTKSSQNQTSIIYYYNEDPRVNKTVKPTPVEYLRLHGEINRIWVKLDQIPDDLAKAFIALEDKRFYEHHGVDWYRLGGVISSMSFDQGASTITQQLIKNITGKNEVTVVRKYNEILSALNMEENFSKNDILEAYLNTVYLGSGCYGVKTAAETYFGKELNELTTAECAMLASITKAPYSYNPLYNFQNNKKRQEYCLSLMLEQGYIDRTKYNRAKNEDIILTNDSRYVSDEAEENPTEQKEEKKQIQNFYMDFVINSVIDDLVNKLGYSKSEATNMIYYGGLKIYSAVDTKIQNKLEKIYSTRSAFPNPNETDTKESPAVQSSMTIMDYSGRVVAIVGQAGKKEENRTLNRAADSPRQPGSSIKPLSVYAPGIDTNVLTWSTMVKNYAIPNNGKLWPKNVDGSYGSGGNVTVQYALEVSLNTVPVRIIKEILPNGIQTSMDYLINHFHLSHVDKTNDYSLPPMAVGAMTNGATTLEMAAAYATFGNGGLYYKPFSYYKVVDNTGEIILSNENVEGERAISEDTAYVMNKLLQTVPTSSYGSGYNVQNFPIMCKTGTTDDDKDRWFCAGTPYYVCSIWYGYDLPKAMHTTVNPCGRIFLSVFSSFHSDLKVKKFPYEEMYEKSDGGTTESSPIVQRAYCKNSGLLASSSCWKGYGWYKADELPKYCASEHVWENTEDDDDDSGDEGGGDTDDGGGNDGGDVALSDIINRFLQ
ncbi:MAG: transglycosylase domain-containing protein [Clostridiales bacterium]|nr:transglycosylase domain-containing protein [Clostridiales bacterium]